MMRSGLQRSALFCVLLASLPAHAELTGTLFTSPEQRAYLDFLRRDFLQRNLERGFDITDAEIPEIPEDVAEQTAAPVYRLEGFSAGSRSGVMVWLNGQRLSERELPAGVRAVQEGGQWLLRVSYQGQSYRLKPGQTLDLGSGNGATESRQQLPAMAEAPVETTVAVDDPVQESVSDKPEETGAAAPVSAAMLVDGIRSLPADELAALITTLDAMHNELETAEDDDVSDTAE